MRRPVYGVKRQGRHRASGIPSGRAIWSPICFDIAADPSLRERMTFASPKTGAPVWRAWQIPRTHADLRARRLFSEQTWVEATFGLMGRVPRSRCRLLHRLRGDAAGVCL